MDPYSDHVQQMQKGYDRPLNSYRDLPRRHYFQETQTMDPYTDHVQQMQTGYDRPLNSYRGPPMRHYFQEDPGDGVYMFVRFPTNNGAAVGVVRQTVVLAQRPLQTLKGHFVGIARKIHVSGNEGKDPRTWDTNRPKDWREEAVVVFWFKTIDNARTFFVSDFRMKQPDFPAPAGICDAWAVVRFYTPPNEHVYSTFMISEARLHSHTRYEDYKERYARRFAKLLLDYDAQPFVVQSAGAEILRRYFVPYDTIVTVHLFKDPAHLAEIKRDPRWYDIAYTQRELAHEDCSVFTIDRRACP